MPAELLFSGVKPTSTPHIGNFIGALKQWVELQHRFRSIFCIVDLHAITVPQDPKQMLERTLEIAATYLAIGLDPRRTTIFVQSEVHEHAELGWILGTLVKMSELERMTQYKDKAKAKGENVGAGLFNYPSLMAADILLYDTTAVPVGEDQMQHVELTRTIARRFNTTFGETFVVPQALVQKVGARIMSLQDPLKKMSKSDESAAATIMLNDGPDVIRKKIARAVTDSGADIAYDAIERPAISNLLTIFHHATGKPIKEIEAEFAGKGYAEFKKALGEAVVEMLAPIQKKLDEYKKDPGELMRVLDEGRDKAQEMAAAKMKIVRERVGLGRL
ncbi:MAG: tryptophan--tRNA ligase [Patescibacteria group bacterium]|nr:tryptophan--tRNA ligase [Patescibacteria group bacterium]